MKPLNINKESCNPISSNCVIWQGPDIECINLCKGDTVTEVVYKLATELCELMDTFNVDNYDLSCFNLLECAPKDFEALIQLLIDKVCACCGETPTVDPGTGSLGCPDCEVNICSAFFYQNPQGDTITTMQLKDYVVAIGNRVCQIIGQIDTINSTLIDHETRITDLENADPPSVTLPQVTPDCVLPSVATPMNVVLDALEEQFCQLRTATGDPQEIYQAILKQCAGLNNANQLSGSGVMSNIVGWASTVTNLSDAMTNVWLTICDLRAAIQNIQANCCEVGCDGISITINAVLNSATQIVVYVNGSVPPAFVDCPGGSVLNLVDSQGGILNISTPILTLLNDPSGYVIDLGPTPVDGNYDITVTLTHCLQDPGSGSQCAGVASDLAAAAINCPVITLIPGVNTIDYSFGWIGAVPQLVTVQLWNSAQSAIITSQSTTATSNGQLISGQFTGLTSGTDYYVRIVVGASDCPYQLITTLTAPCLPPTGAGAQLVLP